MESPFPPNCARKFRAIRLLASGGFGSVYLATQISLERSVAIKILNTDMVQNPNQVARFMAEAMVTASLAHPNVVVILDHDVESGVPWIAYEYISGPNLKQVLRDGPLEIVDALTAASQIASALAAAHSRSVLHRDIKPENVLREGEDCYKVTDFGIATWSSRSNVRTELGLILGTPGYIAPEIIAGEQAHPGSDVYSAGILLYELLTGLAPFAGATVAETLDAQLRGEFVPASQLRTGLLPAVDAVVRNAVMKDPERRYRTAAQLRDALEDCRLSVLNAGRTSLPDEERRLAAGAQLLASSPNLTISSTNVLVQSGRRTTVVPVAVRRRMPVMVWVVALLVAFLGYQHRIRPALLRVTVADVTSRVSKLIPRDEQRLATEEGTRARFLAGFWCGMEAEFRARAAEAEEMNRQIDLLLVLVSQTRPDTAKDHEIVRNLRFRLESRWLASWIGARRWTVLTPFVAVVPPVARRREVRDQAVQAGHVSLDATAQEHWGQYLDALSALLRDRPAGPRRLYDWLPAEVGQLARVYGGPDCAVDAVDSPALSAIRSTLERVVPRLDPEVMTVLVEQWKLAASSYAISLSSVFWKPLVKALDVLETQDAQHPAAFKLASQHLLAHAIAVISGRMLTRFIDNGQLNFQLKTGQRDWILARLEEIIAADSRDLPEIIDLSEAIAHDRSTGPKPEWWLSYYKCRAAVVAFIAEFRLGRYKLLRGLLRGARPAECQQCVEQLRTLPIAFSLEDRIRLIASQMADFYATVDIGNSGDVTCALDLGGCVGSMGEALRQMDLARPEYPRLTRLLSDALAPLTRAVSRDMADLVLAWWGWGLRSPGEEGVRTAARKMIDALAQLQAHHPIPPTAFFSAYVTVAPTVLNQQEAHLTTVMRPLHDLMRDYMRNDAQMVKKAEEQLEEQRGVADLFGGLAKGLRRIEWAPTMPMIQMVLWPRAEMLYCLSWLQRHQLEVFITTARSFSGFEVAPQVATVVNRLPPPLDIAREFSRCLTAFTEYLRNLSQNPMVDGQGLPDLLRYLRTICRAVGRQRHSKPVEQEFAGNFEAFYSALNSLPEPAGPMLKAMVLDFWKDCWQAGGSSMVPSTQTERASHLAQLRKFVGTAPWLDALSASSNVQEVPLSAAKDRRR